MISVYFTLMWFDAHITLSTPIPNLVVLNGTLGKFDVLAYLSLCLYCTGLPTIMNSRIETTTLQKVENTWDAKKKHMQNT